MYRLNKSDDGSSKEDESEGEDFKRSGKASLRKFSHKEY